MAAASSIFHYIAHSVHCYVAYWDYWVWVVLGFIFRSMSGRNAVNLGLNPCLGLFSRLPLKSDHSVYSSTSSSAPFGFLQPCSTQLVQRDCCFRVSKRLILRAIEWSWGDAALWTGCSRIFWAAPVASLVVALFRVTLKNKWLTLLWRTPLLVIRSFGGMRWRDCSRFADGARAAGLRCVMAF